MMRRISLRYIFFTALYFSLVSSPSSEGAGITAGMLTPPTDSAEAERVRIWIPVEGGSSCRVVVKVLAKDGSGRVVKNMVDQVLPPGYHNIYWDKKDSLGQLVDSGAYPYSIDGVCELKKRGKVKAEYKDWERFVEVFPEAENNPGGFAFRLLKDSARVTIEVFSAGNMRINTPMKDSLMMTGYHEFAWPRQLNYPASTYWCWLTVGDYIQKVEFKVKP